MALIDKASLLMVPSTYEAGTLYNVLPSGNRAPDSTDQNSGYDQTRADFTFDRGSNAAATRIGSDGLIKKYRENLLTESNNFSDSDWNKNAGGSFASGQEGYDGSNDAWQFNVTTASNSGAWQNVSFAGVATFSAYFKKGTIDKIGFTNYAGSAYECWFDLTNGTIGQQTGDLIDAKIEAVGTDGWYRCSITDIASGTNYFQLKPSNAYSGTSTAGYIFIQSAQVETGLVATDYLDSGATTAKAGVLIDLPRINYDANGENGSLLLEPSRQQLVQYSEYFGTWVSVVQGTASAPTITTNHATSPDGKQNATRIQFDLNGGTTSSDRVIIRQSLTTQTDYYFSVWMKSATGTDQKILWHSNGDSSDTIITNEWQRFEYDRNSQTVAWAGLSLRGGISSVDTADILVWGFQVERGSYPTSYIPNHGESGGVTRAADSCYATDIANAIGQGEGTIYIETIPADDSTSYTERLIQFESSGSDFMTLQRFSNSSLTFYGTDGTNTWTIQGTNVFTGGEVTKIAAAYKVDDVALYANGTQLSTDTSVATMPNCDRVWFANNSSGSLLYVGSHLKVILFNERLSNAELATLTTL